MSKNYVRHINWKCNLRIFAALSSTDESIPCRVSSANSCSMASYKMLTTTRNVLHVSVVTFAIIHEPYRRENHNGWENNHPWLVYLNSIHVFRSWSRGDTRHRGLLGGKVWQTMSLADLKRVLCKSPEVTGMMGVR